MENEWCTCFGVIKDHIKVQATETDDYIVSTDFLCGELVRERPSGDFSLKN